MLSTAVPPALRKPDGGLPPAPVQYELTAAGRERLSQPAGRLTAQVALLKTLESRPADEAILAESGPRWRATLKKVLEQSWVRAQPAEKAPLNVAPGPTLTPEQQRAVDAVNESLHRFRCHLLDGVTGSGKTEIYLSVLERVLAEGKQGLVLVPEIGLTPQLLRRFRDRFGVAPAVIHSRVSDGERLEAWEAMRTGRGRLLIGTRSALFTPMPDLGLIVLDEEHDASFKQQDGFRYSARDVAVKRAADLSIPILLGSATPSLESLNNVAAGRYGIHFLRQRATDAALPRWRVLDMRQGKTLQGLAAGSIEAITGTLARGEQVMVFLNRRGWAPVLMCQQCGWHGSCERCDSNMTWHRGAGRLCCHHCGSQRKAPAMCPECRADALEGLGEGTQQLEDQLQSLFPSTPVLRFDRDSTSRKGSFDERVEQVVRGDACILVGTQMLAKGHHFPAVTLVVVVNIDQALYSADFRALERLGQTLLQVSGRAGREDKPGTVILQTLHPEDPALNLLIGEGYEAFARWLLEQRRETELPPFSYQALLRAEAHGRPEVERFLREASAAFPKGKAHVFGPMPAIKERVGGRHRMYLMIQSTGRGELHRQLDAWMPGLRALPSARKVRWVLDIDPQEL